MFPRLTELTGTRIQVRFMGMDNEVRWMLYAGGWPDRVVAHTREWKRYRRSVRAGRQRTIYQGNARQRESREDLSLSMAGV